MTEENQSLETSEAEAQPAVMPQKVDPIAEAEMLADVVKATADQIAVVVGDTSETVRALRNLSAALLDGKLNADVAAAVARGDL